MERLHCSSVWGERNDTGMGLMIFHRKTTIFCLERQETNKDGSSLDAVLSVFLRTKKHELKYGRLL